MRILSYFTARLTRRLNILSSDKFQFVRRIGRLSSFARWRRTRATKPTWKLLEWIESYLLSVIVMIYVKLTW
jgi:hypothetical protein